MAARATPSAGPLAPAIAEIRGFNRFYTQHIGALRQGLLDSPYSLTEVRVLYELAHRDGATASELVRELGLTAGYLSRIVRRFEKRRYLARSVSAQDARRQVLALTATGRRAFAELDQRSDAEVGRAVQRLAPQQLQALRGALRTTRRLLEPASARTVGAAADITLRRHRPGDIGWVIHRHGVLYAQEQGWDERFEALVADVAARFVYRFDPAWENSWIAERDGEIVGFVFLVRKARTVAQLRMLLVEPSARGLGLGQRLVAECIAFARACGYKRMVLWTDSGLAPARHIYQQAGFVLKREEQHDEFGVGLTGQHWELRL